VLPPQPPILWSGEEGKRNGEAIIISKHLGYNNN
jgi:hypothetical protein